MKPSILLVAAVFLSGCQTKQIGEMNYSEQMALAEELVQRCLKQGVAQNSPQMRVCTQVEAQAEHARRQNNLAQARRSQTALSAGLQNASNSYRNAAARTAAMNRTVTCRNVPSPAGMSSVRCY